MLKEDGFNSLIPSSINYPVLAEININNITLLKIANGQLLTIGMPGEVLAVRFLLKHSMKSPKTNFVINNYVMQIIAVGKNNTMRVEQIANQVKIQKVQKIVEKKPLLSINDINIKQEGGELF